MARNILNDSLKNHMRVLLSLAPKVCKLPRYDYGAEGFILY